MKVYGPLPVGLCRDRSCLGVAEYRLEPEETTAASCCFCGSTTRPFMQVDGPIHGRHVRCLPGHPRPRGQLYLTLTRAGLRGLNLLPTWTLEQKVPTGMRSAHSSGLASQVIAVCPLSSPSGHRRWTVGGALADFHATAKGQRGQIAGEDPWLAGALQQPGRALGPVQRCRGDPLVGDQLAQQPLDRLAMGAQHRIRQPPVSEQRQHLVGIGVHPSAATLSIHNKRSPCKRLDGLVASHGRAAQDPLDRVVLQADHQPLSLETPMGDRGRSTSGPSQLP